MKLIRKLSKVTALLRGYRKKEKHWPCSHYGRFSRGPSFAYKKAKKENDIVVASIFVNPAQFGPNEDYKKYPRDIKGDAQKAMKAGCDILFCPDAGSMYPKGF